MLIKAIFFLLQKIIDIIGLTIVTIFNLFPSSPFSAINSSAYSSLIANINYFVPVYEFIAIFQAYLVSVSVYYIYSYFARWFKAIQ